LAEEGNAKGEAFGRIPFLTIGLAIAGNLLAMMFRLFKVFVVLALLAQPAAAEAPDSAAAACLESPLPPGQIDCLGKAAKEAGDAELCLLSEEVAVRWQCVALYAEHAGDPEVCRVIPEDDLAPSGLGRELCRVHLALSLREPALCDGLATPHLGDACYFQFVETGGDPALCDRIAYDVLKDACGTPPDDGG
jgi:hypothetical protein